MLFPIIYVNISNSLVLSSKNYAGGPAFFGTTYLLDTPAQRKRLLCHRRNDGDVNLEGPPRIKPESATSPFVQPGQRGDRDARARRPLKQNDVFTPLEDQLVDVGEEGLSASQQSLDLILE